MIPLWSNFVLGLLQQGLNSRHFSRSICRQRNLGFHTYRASAKVCVTTLGIAYNRWRQLLTRNLQGRAGLGWALGCVSGANLCDCIKLQFYSSSTESDL